MPCRGARARVVRWSFSASLAAGIEECEPAGDDLTVQLVGVEAAELVGQTVAEVATRQREIVPRLARLAERRDAGDVADQFDRTALALEAHAVDAVVPG